MGLFKKTQSEKLYGTKSDRLQSRFEKMPTEDLFLLVETAIAESGACLTALRNTVDEAERAEYHRMMDAHVEAFSTALFVMQNREFGVDLYR